MELSHRPLLLCLNIGALVAYVLTAAFNALVSQPQLGVFISSSANISDKYYLEVTPGRWTFSIWGIIYLWQPVWLVYSLTLIRWTRSPGPLYLNPVLLSPFFFFVYITNLIINMGWLLLFDREVLELSIVFQFLMAFTLYMCMWLSYSALEENKSILASQKRTIDDMLVRIFVHNGLGIYAAWTTIATFLNMGFVVAYRSSPPIPQSTASSISLAFIAVVLVTFVVTDLTVFDKYSRYTVTPYAVIIWALGGSIVKNFDVTKANSIVSIVLIVLGGVSLIAKIVVLIVRERSRPILSSTDITIDEQKKVETMEWLKENAFCDLNLKSSKLCQTGTTETDEHAPPGVS